ncbi:MAG: hypothetical protein LBG90_05795 [Spirochaetaceae bacterium]|jgi:uncharacterized protein|nr:hypothetical protein [Spirochaetaceae bacterium]
MNIEQIVFLFFCFSVFGWLFELFLEWLAGRGFVNRGFFYGPIVPIYAVGVFLAYTVSSLFKYSPVLVFFVSTAVCTVLEYCAGWALERFFYVRAWDYDLHPLTFWCNYKKRISVMSSLTFGGFTLLLNCFLGDRIIDFLHTLSPGSIRIFDCAALSAFCIDAVFSFRKYIRNKQAGLFSKTNGQECEDDGLDAFNAVAKDILFHEKFQECKRYIQHGKITVYDHSVAVARMCAHFSVFWRVKDRESLIRGALLHDFFLYDWHDEWNLDHGFTHPKAAAENARKYFSISDKEYSLIQTHMWPFTLLHFPRYKEGWILCLADKIVALKETLHLKQQTTNNKQQTTNNKQQTNYIIFLSFCQEPQPEYLFPFLKPYPLITHSHPRLLFLSLAYQVALEIARRHIFIIKIPFIEE